MRKITILMLLVAFAVAAYPLNGDCAETVHLYLKANGQDIKGNSTQVKGAIPCVSFTGGGSGIGMATGQRQYAPIVIHKRVDQSSPLIQKALTQNQHIEAQFKFFRANPDGSTTEVNTVTIKDARITSVKRLGPTASGQFAPLEEVTFVYQTISVPHEVGHVTSSDKWTAQ